MADEPMPRLRNYRRDYARRQEDLVAAAVAAVLRTEGRVVEEGFRPAEGEARSPDWMMTLDGVPTALEVTRLLPPARVQMAQSLVRVIETDVRSTLTPAITGIGGQVLLALAYSARGVAGRRRAQLASDTQVLATEVRQRLDWLVEGSEPVDFKSSIPWVMRATLTFLPGPHDGIYVDQAPDEAQQPDLGVFVAWAIASKDDQHVGHAGRAILAVDAMFDNEDDLREAFARSPVPVPWWRVYQVLRSDATLVFEKDQKDEVQ